MLVIDPVWSASPPDSLRQFLQTTDFNHRVLNFFGPGFMVARTLPLLVALCAAWRLPRHREALLISVICWVGIVIPLTLFYIYRINDVLFGQAGGSGTSEQIQEFAGQWIAANRLRFAVGCAAYLSLLWAFRLPIPQGGRHPAAQ
jgi:hypothetical protein